MTDFIINDYLLSKECDELAQGIFYDVMDGANGADADDMRDDMNERAHQTADGHEWVIYNYKALMLCANCDTSQGEELLEDIGIGDDPTIYSIASTIAYGEMRARIMSEIEDMIDAWEPEPDADEDADAVGNGD